MKNWDIEIDKDGKKREWFEGVFFISETYKENSILEALENEFVRKDLMNMIEVLQKIDYKN